MIGGMGGSGFMRGAMAGALLAREIVEGIPPPALRATRPGQHGAPAV